MSASSFKPTIFQQCTVEWVCKNLFQANRKVRRFLVADEVGLGKTIIAKHVINDIRKRNGNGKRTIIVYVSSSLDIARQNRPKLAEDEDKEVIETDRICLLYEKGSARAGVNIYSMTPGTSLSLEQGYGNAHERSYIAWIIFQSYRITQKAVSNLFAAPAKTENFENRLKSSGAEMPPKHVLEKLIPAWEAIQLKNGQTFLDVLSAGSAGDSRPEFIRKVRFEVAKCFLSSLNPDLVIFDEFQKFRDLIEIDEIGQVTHSLSRVLLKPEIPTLVLSATPYRLFTPHNKDVNSLGSGGHYQDLNNAISFLTGSKEQGQILVRGIEEYGKLLLKISESNVSRVLEKKQEIEEQIMKVMSRTERIMFSPRSSSGIEAKFLSDEKSNTLTKENLKQYLTVAPYVSSRRMWLTYWKSGAFPMSYMQKDYELVSQALKKSDKSKNSLTKERHLYSSLKGNSESSIKLNYIYKEIFKEGENFKYLWVPPTKFYYQGMGPFDQRLLKKADIKKGLVFSSWAFVPRMAAAEISSRKEDWIKRVPRKTNPLHGSTVNWSKFFFPSRKLSMLLSHEEFVSAGDYASILRSVKGKIREVLSKGNAQEIKNNEVASSTWQVLSFIEFNTLEEEGVKDQLLSLYQGKRSRYNKFLRNKDSKTLGLDAEAIKQIGRANKIVRYNARTIQELAEIAISSPSICILRAMESAIGGKIDEDMWLHLSAFCAHDLRNYLNRESTFSAIWQSYKNGRYSDRAQRYFRDSCFQAVLDEYFYLCKSGSGRKGFEGLLRRLGHAISARRSSFNVEISHNKTQRVSADIIAAFGQGHEESDSRDLIRESFNSPFWPMALITTSVGQEGLDFHLYCKDIFHWDLPSNPVDFEQREGRINRFNSFTVRQSLAATQLGMPKLLENEHLWDANFRDSHNWSHRSDRYNLGMSPNWIYTPVQEGHRADISRHILDVPCSSDRNKYDKLIRDLTTYRLALGQPHQREYMVKVNKNEYLDRTDIRGVMLNFTPFKQKGREEQTQALLRSPDRLRRLVADAREHLSTAKRWKHYEKLETETERIIERLNKSLKSFDCGPARKGELGKVVNALLYFVDPHDHAPERSYEHGFASALKVLRQVK